MYSFRRMKSGLTFRSLSSIVLMETSYAFHPINLLEICASIVFHSVRNFNPDALVFRRVKKSHSSREATQRKEKSSKVYSEDSDHPSESKAKRGDSRRGGSRTHSMEHALSSGRARASARESPYPKPSLIDEGSVVSDISGEPVTSARRGRLEMASSNEGGGEAEHKAFTSSSHRRRHATGGRGREGSGLPTRSTSNASLFPTGKSALAEGYRQHRPHRTGSANGPSNHRQHRSLSLTESKAERHGTPPLKKGQRTKHSHRSSKSHSFWRNLVPSEWKHRWSSQRFATKMAVFYTHLFHSLPVSFLHYLCELQRQHGALPILRFSDVSERGKESIFSFFPTMEAATMMDPLSEASLSSASRAESSSSTKFFSLASSSENVFTKAFSSSLPAASLNSDFSNDMDDTRRTGDSRAFHSSFLVVRELFRLLFLYIEDVFFMDNTIVARQLRSRNYAKRMIGWCIRIISHSLFDAVFLSVLSPAVCMTVQDFSMTGPLRLTIPGLIKGLSWSTGLVLIQEFVLPTLSHLMNRATVTMFEGLEYFIQRRYTYVDSFACCASDASSFSIAQSPLSEEDSVALRLQLPLRSVSESSPLSLSSPQPTPSSQLLLVNQHQSTVGPSNPNAHFASVLEKDAHPERKTSRIDESKKGANEITEDTELAQRLRDQERVYAQLRRKKRRARQKQLEAMETRAQQVILRAILYRMASLLVAQIVVEHPVNVLLEGMRGRALMHFTGVLAAYDNETSSGLLFPFCWSGWRSYWSHCTRSGVPPSRVEEESSIASKHHVTAPLPLSLLRAMWGAAGSEVEIVWNAVIRASGEFSAISQVLHRVSHSGRLPSVGDSFQLAWHSCLGLRSLYSGISFTVFNGLTSFYMATWRRLQG